MNFFRTSQLDGLSDRLNDVGRQAGEWQKQAQRLAVRRPPFPLLVCG
jgi:hypothetical protein